MGKFLIELRRRGWVLALSVAAALAAVLALADAGPSESSAEAILVVRAQGRLAEQPDSSTRLAATYAKLIPVDARVENTVKRTIPDPAGWSIATTNDPNTALLRLVFSAELAEDAVDGAGLAAKAISGPRPVSRNIRPNSVAIVSVPTSAQGSGGTGQSLAVGLILGVFIGLVIISYWRRRDARVDTIAEARDTLACPCFEHRRDKQSDARLAHAVEIAGDGPIAVVPGRSRDKVVAESVFKALTAELGKKDVFKAAAPESADAGELIAAKADTVILVFASGIRKDDLDHAADILDRHRAAPACAIFARR
jgi:hypothetical protein